jgi:hypothetical protein
MADPARAGAGAEDGAAARPRPKPDRAPGGASGAAGAVPAHVATMLGLSVAGYGLALALVTGLQAASEAAISADRAPLGRAIDELAAGHDRLERELRDTAATYADAAAGYATAVGALAGLDDRLATLAASVEVVDGAARALPASVALPPVVRSVRPAATRPSAHVTSGGSAVR